MKKNNILNGMITIMNKIKPILLAIALLFLFTYVIGYIERLISTHKGVESKRPLMAKVSKTIPLKVTGKKYTKSKEIKKSSTLNNKTEKKYYRDHVYEEKLLNKNELDDMWLKNMEDRFARRRSRIKDWCDDNESNLSYVTKKTLQEMFMASKYGLFVCLVGKAGSTTWSYHLLELNGYKNENGDRNKVRARNHLSLSEVNKSMHNPAYTHVMTVRHPLDRIVSAYRHWFMDGGEMKFRTYIREAASHLNKSVNNIKRVSFKDYLNIVLRDTLESKSKGTENFHWKSFKSNCLPCQINYDYIMKMETYNEDLSYVFRKIGVTKYNTDLQKNDHVKIKYEKYYEDIPDDIIREIHQLFKEDYELFGYDIPEFVKNVL